MTRAIVAIARKNKDAEAITVYRRIAGLGSADHVKHPNGATIIIPTSSFLHPVMENHCEQILKNYREEIRSAL
ncbi:MAG: hypothetical protein KIT59_10110 [Nitrosomonas sp.]|nr:hypothetical protein [Nitrosomonas sp.]